MKAQPQHYIPSPYIPQKIKLITTIKNIIYIVPHHVQVFPQPLAASILYWGNTSETGQRVSRCSTLAIIGSNQAIGIAQDTAKQPVNDAELVVELRQHVSELPSYDYLRVWGLLRSAHEKRSRPVTNVERVYWVMRDHNLLLERRIKQHGAPGRHEDRIAVLTSDTRWYSDGFEFRCEDGAKLSVPARSSQSNGMAEKFVKTNKRDSEAHMPKPDRVTALRNLAIAFEHYNKQHPHSALKYCSPRAFRRLAVASS
jgi:transposase InsO family protein